MKSESKLVAILSYITVIGWVIALIINFKKRTSLGSFHLRQALLIFLASAVFAFVPTVGGFLQIIFLVFLIIGLISAIKGQEKEIPLIGKYAQDWFNEL